MFTYVYTYTQKHIQLRYLIGNNVNYKILLITAYPVSKLDMNMQMNSEISLAKVLCNKLKSTEQTELILYSLSNQKDILQYLLSS